MKKLTFALLFLGLCACVPQPTVRDSMCASIEELIVIQVREDMVLAWADVGADEELYSPTTFYHPNDEHYLFLKKEPYQVYYPGQVIRLPDSACVQYAGSYSYVVNNQHGAKTLKGVFEPSQVPNPEYAELEKELREKAKTSPWWKRRYERKFGKLPQE